jgi:hypothetical protein
MDLTVLGCGSGLERQAGLKAKGLKELELWLRAGTRLRAGRAFALVVLSQFL